MILIMLSIVSLVGGLVGCIVPALPGPLLSYTALLLLEGGTPAMHFSKSALLFLGVITIILSCFDFLLPFIGARLYKASTLGIAGAFLGMFAGLVFFPPFGLFAGMIIGAIAGEWAAGKNLHEALGAGIASGIASITLFLIKFAFSIFLTFYYCSAVIKFISA